MEVEDLELEPDAGENDVEPYTEEKDLVSEMIDDFKVGDVPQSDVEVIDLVSQKAEEKETKKDKKAAKKKSKNK